MDPRRRLLLDLLDAALAAVNGRTATRAALAARTDPRSVHVAAVGKAAASMALGAHDALGSALERTLIITKEGHLEPGTHLLPNVDQIEAGHPVPDARSLAAGDRLLRWADELPASVQPIVLLSGGASSLAESLAEDATLEGLVNLTVTGLAGGFDITALNARRASLSRIKAGRFARRLLGRRALALFISDVPGDDPNVIGSGLMGGFENSRDDVVRVVVASIGAALAAAAEAAARAGLRVATAAERFEGDAARLAVRFVHELHLSTEQ